MQSYQSIDSDSLDIQENNPLLFIEKNFLLRMEALDFLEFQLMHHAQTDVPNEQTLKALKLKSKLEGINAKLFQQLREKIRKEKIRRHAFKKLVEEYFDPEEEEEINHPQPAYTNLDIFINGVLSDQPIPDQTKETEPEKISYHKTPATIIFKLVEEIKFDPRDIFMDLGSGTGQVAILFYLLTGVQCAGIEFEPAFCRYAEEIVSFLQLSDVKICCGDVRNADLSQGTLFFLFTPFTGEMLQNVLQKLKAVSHRHKIKIIAYGPCSVEIAMQNWLQPLSNPTDHPYSLQIFQSR